MTYHSVEEILSEKKNVLARLDDRLRTVDESLLRLRVQTDAWSIADILEHLVLAERAMLLLIESLLRKARTISEQENPSPTFEVALDDVIERSRTAKFSTPERFRPTDQAPIEDSLKELRELQAQLVGLRPRLEAADLTSASFRHWTFGPLNLGQWLAFVSHHERRHLAQIEAILESSGVRGVQS
ncbi:MAG: DinB family protein [Ignavibacteria bacterium]|nr:DinB family protein [Ignavibacteria bacterium]